MNNDIKLDDKKLKMIKYKVITLEKDNVIKKDPTSKIVDDIRKYIEKVVDGKC